MKNEELLQYLKDVQATELDIITLEGVIDRLWWQKPVQSSPYRDFFELLVDGVIHREEILDFSVLFDRQILAIIIPTILGIILAVLTRTGGVVYSLFVIGLVLSISLGIVRNKRIQERANAIEEMISEYQKLLNEAEATKEELYSLDVIYKKYRSLIPVSMFVEYIESGLRDKLEGADGAYDLYEQERRHGEVLGSMGEIQEAVTQIGEQLGEISKNQAALIESVEKCNNKMGELTDAAIRSAEAGEKLVDQANYIRYNTEITKRHAENIEKYTRSIDRDGVIAYIHN